MHHENAMAQHDLIPTHMFVQTSSRASWSCNVFKSMRLICADIRHPAVHHEIAMAQPVFLFKHICLCLHSVVHHDIAMCWNLCCHPIMHHEIATAQHDFIPTQVFVLATCRASWNHEITMAQSLVQKICADIQSCIMKLQRVDIYAINLCRHQTSRRASWNCNGTARFFYFNTYVCVGILSCIKKLWDCNVLKFVLSSYHASWKCNGTARFLLQHIGLCWHSVVHHESAMCWHPCD
jgi:hypothetical protein